MHAGRARLGASAARTCAGDASSADHGEPRVAQREGEATGADPELEHRTGPGEAGQHGDRTLGVEGRRRTSRRRRRRRPRRSARGRAALRQSGRAEWRGRPGGGRPAEVGVAQPAAITEPLAPATLTDMLDGGWRLLRRQPGTILGLSAMFLVPSAVLAGLASAAVDSDVQSTFAFPTFGDSSFPLAGAVRHRGRRGGPVPRRALPRCGPHLRRAGGRLGVGPRRG